MIRFGVPADGRPGAESSDGTRGEPFTCRYREEKIMQSEMMNRTTAKGEPVTAIPDVDAASIAPRRARFSAVLRQAGKTATGFEVPPEVVESLGGGKRPPVRVTINGHTYRNTIAVMGGVFMLGVSAENRAGAGVAGGDIVDVELELDTAPREVTVPPDFSEALDRDAVARAAFDRLSYSHRRQHVLAIDGAKTAETRLRRIEKAIVMLREKG
jgi:hypothetical protein